MGEPIASVKAKCPGETVLTTCEERLLFTLFSIKSGLTYDNLGFVAGMDGSNAKRNQDFGLSILKEAIQGMDPKREFASLEEYPLHFADSETLLIDGTEQQSKALKSRAARKPLIAAEKKAPPLKRPSLRRKTRSSAS